MEHYSTEPITTRKFLEGAIDLSKNMDSGLCPECGLPPAESQIEEGLVKTTYFYCANGHTWNNVQIED